MADPDRDHALSRTQHGSSPSGERSDMGHDATVSSEPGHADRAPRSGLRLAPGTRIGDRLALERKIGMGGMGEVWAARHTVLDKSVAVKFLLDHVPGSDEVAQRFLREARAAAGLDHPGIVDVQDFGNTPDGTPYLVMELLAGRPLSDHLASAGRLDWRTARHWLLQITAALGFAHRRGVIHRDLKPSNIFLVDHDDSVTCKLIDFGLAKITRGDAPVDPLTTRTGAILGTPTYMSPEQLKAQEVDLRADIYALGCVAYEMLTGVQAFRAGSSTELAAKHLYEPPASEPLHAVGTPPAFVELVLRCLQKDPAARFQSTADLRAALEVALPGGVIPGKAVAPAAPLDPTVHSGDLDLRPPDPRSSNLSPGTAPSRRPLAIVAGAAALAIVVTVAVLTARRDPPPAPTAPTPPPASPTAPSLATAAPLATATAAPLATAPTTAPAIPAPPIDPTPPAIDVPADPTAPPPRTKPRPRPRPGVDAPPNPEPAPPPSEPTPPPEPPAPPPVPKDTRGDRNGLKDPFAPP